MTRFNIDEMECPDCKEKVKVNLYESINVQKTPHLRDELLSWSINRFECNNCNLFACLTQELMYVDEERGICFQLFPIEHAYLEDLIRRVKKDGSIHSEDRLDLRDRIRHLVPDLSEDTDIVLSFEELLVYIKFQEKLFDLKNNILRPEFTL